MISRRDIGFALIACGILSFALVIGASAVLTPSLSVDNTGVNDTLVGIQGSGIAIEESGGVALLDSNGSPNWTYGRADSYFGVSSLSNGTVLAAFTKNRVQNNCGPFNPPCARTGYRIIEPQPQPHVISEWTFPVSDSTNREVHDVERLPSGEILMADMAYERIMTVAPNGTITWQWNASSHYTPPAPPMSTDWLHINDVDQIGSDRYMVSVRNKNQLLIIERNAGVVDVVNRQGSTAILNHQHNPQWLGQNAILVADSENDRVVELHRNESTDRWEIAWVLEKAGGVELDWPRDADRQPDGTTLITDSRNRRVVEVDESGELIWSASTSNRIPYEADRKPIDDTGYLTTNQKPPVYNESEFSSIDSGIPLLSSAVDGIRTNLPVPFWFGEFHLITFLFAIITVASGTWLAWPRGIATQYKQKSDILRLAVIILAGGFTVWSLTELLTPEGMPYTGLYLAATVLTVLTGWHECSQVLPLNQWIPGRALVAIERILAASGIVLATGLVIRIPTGGLQPIYLILAALIIHQVLWFSRSAH